jgi:hypothetical protein
MTKYENIASAFVAAQAQITHVVKRKTGQAAGATYRYAELSDVIEMVRPILHAHGLAFQSINSPHPNGALVRTRLIHESGETMESDGTFIPISDVRKRDGSVIPAGAQQAGSAYTYSRRYDLIAMLGIAADDDDGAAAMQAQAAKVERAKRLASSPPLTHEQSAVLTLIARAARPDRQPDLTGKLAEDYEQHVRAFVKFAAKEGAIGKDAADDVVNAAMALDVQRVNAALQAVPA